METDDANTADAPEKVGPVSEKKARTPAWHGWLAAGALVLMLFLILYSLQEYKVLWRPVSLQGATAP